MVRLVGIKKKSIRLANWMVGGGMKRRGLCCKVWAAQCGASLGVITIEWSLIDCLS